MRVFVALELPEDMQDALLENLAELRELVDGRPVRQDSLHLTLAFIGEVGASDIPKIVNCIRNACFDARAISLELDDYGSFGPKHKAVLWQGVNAPDELSELANRVRQELTAAGYEIDPKPFKPHITLMRNADLTKGILPMPFVTEGDVASVTLFQTIWEDGKAHYEALETVELPGAYVPDRPTLLIDADACPVTKEALAAARKAKIPVVIAGNSAQNLLKHAKKNDPLEPCDGFWIDTLVASSGADSADFAIVERLNPGDIVVTQDIGLAAMVLGRGASAIGVRGREYTLESIDAQLLVRHEEKKVRRAGGRTAGPAAFTNEDRARFLVNLERMLGV